MTLCGTHDGARNTEINTEHCVYRNEKAETRHERQRAQERDASDNTKHDQLYSYLSDDQHITRGQSAVLNSRLIGRASGALCWLGVGRGWREGAEAMPGASSVRAEERRDEWPEEAQE